MTDTDLLSTIFLIIGGIISGIFFVVGLYHLSKNKREKKCTCKIYGKIISNIRREERYGADRLHDTRFRWYSLCEYTVGKEKCVRETNIGTLQPRKIGETVTIYYNPQNCHEAYIDGDNNSKVKATICFILGIVLIIFLYIFIKIMQ